MFGILDSYFNYYFRYIKLNFLIKGHLDLWYLIMNKSVQKSSLQYSDFHLHRVTHIYKLVPYIVKLLKDVDHRVGVQLME